jgi:hypothetical protein
VTGGVLHPHVVAGGRAIETVPRRVPAGQPGLVVAAPDDPGARRLLLRPAGDRVVDVVDPGAVLRAERHIIEADPEPGHVIVRVVEARDHRRPRQIDAPPRGQISRVVPERDDAAVKHRQRVRAPGTRDDGGILVDRIHSHGRTLSIDR